MRNFVCQQIEKIAQTVLAAPLPAPLQPARSEHLARLWLQAGQPQKAAKLLLNNMSAVPQQTGEALWPTMLALTLAPHTSATQQVASQFAASNPATASLLPQGPETIPTSPQAHVAATFASETQVVCLASQFFGPASANAYRRNRDSLSGWLAG